MGDNKRFRAGVLFGDEVKELLDYVEDLLRTRHGVRQVIRLKKPDASRPAPPEVVAQMSSCDAVISAVGD